MEYLSTEIEWTSQIAIATNLDIENTTLLNSSIQFHMFTNISDAYTKYET